MREKVVQNSAGTGKSIYMHRETEKEPGRTGGGAGNGSVVNGVTAVEACPRKRQKGGDRWGGRQ